MLNRINQWGVDFIDGASSLMTFFGFGLFTKLDVYIKSMEKNFMIPMYTIAFVFMIFLILSDVSKRLRGKLDIGGFLSKNFGDLLYTSLMICGIPTFWFGFIKIASYLNRLLNSTPAKDLEILATKANIADTVGLSTTVVLFCLVIGVAMILMAFVAGWIFLELLILFCLGPICIVKNYTNSDVIEFYYMEVFTRLLTPTIFTLGFKVLVYATSIGTAMESQFLILIGVFFVFGLPSFINKLILQKMASTHGKELSEMGGRFARMAALV